MRFSMTFIALALCVACTQAFAQAIPKPARGEKPASPKNVVNAEMPNAISIMGFRLELAESERLPTAQIWEYVSPNEKLNDWTVLFTVRRYKGDHLDPRASVMKTEEKIKELKKTDEAANSAVYQSEKDGSWTIDFLMTGEGFFEHNVFRYFKVKGGLVSHQYAQRAYLQRSEDEPPRRHLWSKNPQGQIPALELFALIGKQRNELFEELSRKDLPFSSQAIPPTATAVPTPKMAVMFDMDSAPGEWEMKIMDGNSDAILCQFGPQGKSAWGELVTQKVIFNVMSVKEFVETWTQALLEDDPKTEISQKRNPDGSITANFHSTGDLGAGICRFMQGPDGIYTLAYNVRPDFRSGTDRQSWSKIIDEASLIRNPLLNQTKKATR